MSSSTPEPAPGVIDRVQTFVSEHRRAVLITAAVAVAAIGATAYYASTSRGDAERAARRRKERKDKGKKKKTVKDEDGPILEEVEPKPDSLVDGAFSGGSLHWGTRSRRNSVPLEELLLTAQTIAALTEEVCLPYACMLFRL